MMMSGEKIEGHDILNSFNETFPLVPCSYPRMRLNVYFKKLFQKTKKIGMESSSCLTVNGKFRDNIIFASINTNTGDRKIIPLLHQTSENLTLEDIHKKFMRARHIEGLGCVVLTLGNGGLGLAGLATGMCSGGHFLFDSLTCWFCSFVAVSGIGICGIATSSIYKKFLHSKYNKNSWEYPGHNTQIKVSDRIIRELSSVRDIGKLTYLYYPWYEWHMLAGKDNEHLDHIATISHDLDTDVIHIDKSNDPDLMNELHVSYGVASTSLTIDD